MAAEKLFSTDNRGWPLSVGMVVNKRISITPYGRYEGRRMGVAPSNRSRIEAES